MNGSKTNNMFTRRGMVGLLTESVLVAALCPALLIHRPGRAQAGQVRRVSLTIQGRQVVGVGSAIRVAEGDQVELVWSTDEEVALHLHGYDIELTVSPGATQTMSFEAYATGRFPVTSHGFGGDDHHGGHDAPLIYFEVHPH